MGRNALPLAIVSGIATVLLVGIAVTEFTGSWIEFSLFLGIPAGLAAGALVAAAVFLGLADDAPASRRRIARAFAAFGIGFLAAVLVLAGVLDVGVSTAVVVSILVGLAIAAVAYLRGATATAATMDDGDAGRSAHR